MPHPTVDITGQTFGRLTAIELVDQRKRGARMWRFACACGREAVLEGNLVRYGRVQSCGCIISERLANSKSPAAKWRKRAKELQDKLSELKKEVSKLKCANTKLVKAQSKAEAALQKAAASQEAFRLDNIKLRVRLRGLEKQIAQMAKPTSKKSEKEHVVPNRTTGILATSFDELQVQWD